MGTHAENLEKKESLLSSHEYLILCLICLFLSLGQFLCSTLIPKYADTLNATATTIGFLSSVFAVPSLVCKPFIAPAEDSFNKRNILFVGVVLVFISLCGYAFSKSVESLFVFRVIHGFASGVTSVTSLAMLSESLSEKLFTTGIMYYSIVQAFAAAVGPGTGIALADVVGYSGTFLIGAGMMAVPVFFLLRWKSTQESERKPYKLSLSTIIAKEVVPTALMTLCLSAVYVSISSFLVLYAESINVSGIGLFFTIHAGALLISRPLIVKVSHKMGAVNVTILSILLFAAGMVLISYSTNLTMFIIAAILVACGYGACIPLLQAICLKFVPPERRGSASATSYYGTDLGYIIAPAISGFAVDWLGYAAMFRLMNVFLVLALAILLLTRKKFEEFEAVK